MRRLLVASTLLAAVFADDGTLEQRAGRRERFSELTVSDPLALPLLISMHAGPETAPPEAVDGRLTALVRG
jgi:hypothetical protein